MHPYFIAIFFLLSKQIWDHLHGYVFVVVSLLLQYTIMQSDTAFPLLHVWICKHEAFSSFSIGFSNAELLNHGYIITIHTTMLKRFSSCQLAVVNYYFIEMLLCAVRMVFLCCKQAHVEISWLVLFVWKVRQYYFHISALHTEYSYRNENRPL